MTDDLGELARRAAAADPAEGLEAIVALRRRLDGLENAHVERALGQGWSWSRVGRALGVTKQAVHRRHARRRLEPAPTDATVAGAGEAPSQREVRPPSRSPSAPTQTAAGSQRARLVVTGEARVAVEHARREATRLRRSTVLPEHLLLGLLHAEAAPARALAGLGATPEDVRTEVARLANAEESEPREAPPPGSRPPISPRARAVFEQSLREAVDRGDPHLGPEHVLLALLRSSDGLTAAALDGLGLSTATVRRRLEEVLAEGTGGARPPGP